MLGLKRRKEFLNPKEMLKHEHALDAPDFQPWVIDFS
jgi:hypothetical protein